MLVIPVIEIFHSYKVLTGVKHVVENVQYEIMNAFPPEQLQAM